MARASASAIETALWWLLFWPCARGSPRGSLESRSAIETVSAIVGAHLAAAVKAIVLVVAREIFAKDAMNPPVVWHRSRARPSPNLDCVPSCFRYDPGSCVRHPTACAARYPAEEHMPVVVNQLVP